MSWAIRSRTVLKETKDGERLDRGHPRISVEWISKGYTWFGHRRAPLTQREGLATSALGVSGDGPILVRACQQVKPTLRTASAHLATSVCNLANLGHGSA